ncbi:hypothetical protein NSE_0586 [Neorickettsia sennetsu str. Miyayama]|uniref:Uncharacterized protein n=1 Tax=Ehrlichia sennetsu (strain ATCC VR-367 / Miyayama) TaxID=222891 RepID=Q2GDI0_EHRS3|nr:hypothetical protein NSE_0586 [Neorickettsia sennetsu str. Miyayama]
MKRKGVVHTDNKLLEIALQPHKKMHHLSGSTTQHNFREYNPQKFLINRNENLF